MLTITKLKFSILIPFSVCSNLAFTVSFRNPKINSVLYNIICILFAYSNCNFYFIRNLSEIRFLKLSSKESFLLLTGNKSLFQTFVLDSRILGTKGLCLTEMDESDLREILFLHSLINEGSSARMEAVIKSIQDCIYHSE